MLAEVLLQQTRAEHVAEVFGDILDRCPDWESLASVPPHELEEILKPLGIYRRRARVLVSLAKSVVENGLPSAAADLMALPGIGQYMSRAIAVQLSGDVLAPVDTNVSRVLERAFGPRKLADIRYDKQLQKLALQLVPATEPGNYFVALVDFAAEVCRARNPNCPQCPVSLCAYGSASRERSQLMETRGS